MQSLWLFGYGGGSGTTEDDEKHDMTEKKRWRLLVYNWSSLSSSQAYYASTKEVHIHCAWDEYKKIECMKIHGYFYVNIWILFIYLPHHIIRNILFAAAVSREKIVFLNGKLLHVYILKVTVPPSHKHFRELS